MHFLVFLSAVVACAAGFPADTTELKREGRIVGGENATGYEFKYMMSLTFNGSHRCGGVIIRPNWALTAAECIYNTSHGNVTVRGFTGVTNRQNRAQIREVTKIIPHDNYNSKIRYRNNIALLKFRIAFDVSHDTVEPIGLSSHFSSENTVAVFTGWGATNRQARAPTPTGILQSILMKIMSKSECYNRFPSVNRSVLCARAFFSKADYGPWNGDYGGPLVIGRELVGISIYFNNTSEDRKGIYFFFKISTYYKWIIKTIDDNNI